MRLKKITGPLTTEILQQSDDLPDAETVEDAKSDALHKHKTQETENNNIIKVSQEPAMQRTIEQLSEPGASSWLAALPLESHSFNLTKAEFQDVGCVERDQCVVLWMSSGFFRIEHTGERVW